jgi:hypothetical protein
MGAERFRSGGVSATDSRDYRDGASKLSIFALQKKSWLNRTSESLSQVGNGGLPPALNFLPGNLGDFRRGQATLPYLRDNLRITFLFGYRLSKQCRLTITRRAVIQSARSDTDFSVTAAEAGRQRSYLFVFIQSRNLDFPIAKSAGR